MKIYLEFPETKVKGESKNKDYKDQIEVLSFGNGFENNINIGGISSGSGAGKSNSQGIVFSKNVDSASNVLFDYLHLGKHFDFAKFHFTRTIGAAGDKGRQDIFCIELAMVMIESIDYGASDGDGTIEEQVVLKYGAIKQSYNKQDSKGGLTPYNASEWSYVLNIDAFKIR